MPTGKPGLENRRQTSISASDPGSTLVFAEFQKMGLTHQQVSDLSQKIQLMGDEDVIEQKYLFR